MAIRRIARTKAETTALTRDSAVVAFTTTPKLAWGLGVYSRICGQSIGELLGPAVDELLRAKRIPWSAYDEAVEAVQARRRGVAARQDAANDAVEAFPIGETTPAPELAEAPAGEGKTSEPRRSPAEVVERIRRRRAG